MEEQIQQLIISAQEAESPTHLRVVWGRFIKLLAEKMKMTSAHLCYHDFVKQESTVEAEYFSRRSEFLESQSEVGKSFPESGFPNTAAWLRQPNLAPRVIHTSEMTLDDPERQEFVHYQVKTAVFFKIAIEGNVWGYIELWCSRVKREFTQEELSQLQRSTNKLTQSILAQQG